MIRVSYIFTEIKLQYYIGDVKEKLKKWREIVYLLVFFLFCFAFAFFAFIKSVALRSVVPRYACCIDSHMQLVNSCLWALFSFLYFSLEMSLFPFLSEYHVPLHCRFLLWIVRGTFSLRMVCFLGFFTW